MSKRQTVLFFFLTLGTLLNLNGQVALQSEKSSWQIGVESFSGDLSDPYLYLENSIPDLLIRELEEAGQHILSEDEKTKIQLSVIENKRVSLINELPKAYAKQDLKLFNATEIGDQSIEELETKLLNLSTLDPGSIKTASMLPVLWYKPENGEELLPINEYSASVVCKIHNLDFLVKGRIREVGEYFRLEILGYNRANEKEFVLFSGTTSPDRLSSLAVEAAGELRSIVLGRAWSALTVATDNPDALIYCNGELIGVGSASVKTLQPGKVLLEAVGQDNSYWSKETELKALETSSISAVLTEGKKDLLSLESEPSGASVYIGARWVGESPLKIPRFENRSYWLTVKSDGYYDHSFEISPQSEDNISVTLEVKEMTRQDFFELKKKEFYRSLGWFSLSVAAPVISAGVYNNYISRQNVYATEYLATGDPDFYNLAGEMENNYYISYGVFWGTIGISGGLLVDVFVKLSRYIKAAEALAE